MAWPMPPATHIDSIPYCLSRVSRSLSSVVMIRAPVMPNGWPRAIAPPNGLSLSSDPEIVAARHDLRRERLVDLDDVDVVDRHPGLLEQRADRGDRAEAHDLRPDRGDGRGD